MGYHLPKMNFCHQWWQNWNGGSVNEIEKSKVRELAGEIERLINERQYKALKQMTAGTVDLYWSIGGMICDRQEKEGWGKSVVEGLAEELQRKFPGAQGYSARNLWRMRNFYVTYGENEKLSPLVTEISWSCNLVIMNTLPLFLLSSGARVA